MKKFKTSSIISAAFFFFVFGGTVVLYADAAKHGEERNNAWQEERKAEEYKGHEYNVLPFKTIVIGEEISVVMRTGAENRITFFSPLNETVLKAEDLYKVQNDTLYIISSPKFLNVECVEINSILAQNSNDVRINLGNISSNLNIKSENSNVYLGGLNAPSVTITFLQGYLELIDVTTELLNIDLKDTKTKYHNLRAKNINLKQENSQDL